MKKTKSNSRTVGFLFIFAAFLAVGGPMILTRAGDNEKYDVPEPAVLNAADTKFVDAQTATFCSASEKLQANPAWPAPPMKQIIPIVLFHRITDKDDPSREVTHTALFKQQMSWLRAEGYETMSMAEVEAYIRGVGVAPKKPIVITFDDGWKDNVEAAKYLQSLDMGATFYIVSGFFAAKQYIDQVDLKWLASNPKFEIGSHSHSHFVKHPDVSKVDLCTFAKELSASKLILERIIEKPVTTFAWPYGFATKETVYAAGALGYTNTTHVNRDTFNSPGHSPLYIRRLNIDGGCSLEDFKTMVRTGVLKECSSKPGSH